MKENKTADTTIRGPWLHILRAVWLILALVMVLLWIAGTLFYVGEPFPDCSEIICDNIDVTAADVESAIDQGVSREITEVVGKVAGSLSILTGIFYFIIAGVIFWRLSNDWLGMLVSITLIFLGALGFTSSNDALLRVYPQLIEIHDLILSIGFTGIIALFLLFPNGRFVPSWIGWVSALAAVLIVVNTIVSPSDYGRETLELVLLLFLILLSSLSQIYRYFRVSTVEAKQQTKWVVLGLLGSLMLMVIWTLMGIFYPPDQPGASRLVPLFASIILITIFALILPLSFALSILRYRLWDIDLIFNRGLIYGSMTILLALIYFGTISLLQALFTALTGQQSPITLVVSTLIIAALFQPLYRRVQELINRRFYRGKYDAEKILTNFAETARDEVDLDKLTAAVAAAAEETLHPTTISVWLIEPTGGPDVITKNDSED